MSMKTESFEAVRNKNINLSIIIQQMLEAP